MDSAWPGHPEQIPEYYADLLKISANLFSFVLEFGLQGVPDAPTSEQPPGKLLARVRLSPPHALILSKILVKNLRLYQEAVGPIAIPDRVYEELGIPREGQDSHGTSRRSP